MTLVLQDEGYRVETAANGEDALARLRVLAATSELPSLVVLDWLMPIMDGSAVVRALDGDPELASIPVLILSAASDPMPRIARHGVLRKPVDLDALLDAVRLRAQH